MIDQNLKDICCKLKPLIGQKADALWLAYTSSENLNARQEAEALIYMFAARHLTRNVNDDTILLPKITAEKAAGEFHLGTVQYANRPIFPVGLNRDNFIRHIGISNIVICKPEVVMKKLGINTLQKYDDIQVLNDEDGTITTYPTFCCVDYIAGLLDGDGDFNMSYRASDRSENGRYTPQILLVNTNKEIIRRYCSVLRNNGIGYHISFRTAGKTTNRRRWDILVSGVKRGIKAIKKKQLEQ